MCGHKLYIYTQTDMYILQARILEWVAHSLLQGFFLTQGLNLGLLHCGQILCHLSHIYRCIGEGNGNPLQCSCLENPRDGGA